MDISPRINGPNKVLWVTSVNFAFCQTAAIVPALGGPGRVVLTALVALLGVGMAGLALQGRRRR